MKTRLALYLLFVVVILSNISFATNFNSCTTFALSDTYDLTSNITVNGSSCLTVAIATPTAPTVIDCHGYTIRGNYTNGTNGITYTLSNNVTLQNCIFKDFGTNLVTTDGDNLLFQNNTFDNSSFTNIQLCTSTMCNNLTFTNNTVSNGFNNGIELYGANNSAFNNNSCFLHEHGHGTDRCFHLDKNIYNSQFNYNYLYNNTLGFRLNNVNFSNVTIQYNQILNTTSQGLNMQATSGTFENIDFSYNSLTGAANSIGFDATIPAASTKQSDCGQITMIGNNVTGGQLIYLNALNSSGSFSSITVGGMLMCDADNVVLNNITLIGGGDGRNAIELMHVNNLTLDGLNATNFYTAIRGLIVNDSVFTNISLDGGQISSINFAGGTSSRNNISFVNITNVKANAAISLGGANNTASDFYIHDSNTTGSSIGFASATTTSGNTYQRFLVQNMTRGISFTNIGSGNIIKDIQLVNVSEAYLVNSTASGTKTITLQNITISEAGGTPPRMFFDLFDTVSPSEQYLIHLPGDFTPSSMIDNRSIFRYHVLNYTIYAGSPSIDNFNFTWFDSELYNGNNEATLESYYYNATSGSWLLMNNSRDTINNKIGQNPLSLGGIYGLFDYVNCPVITVAEPFEQQQNFTGAPNFIGGQFSCIYINVSDADIECADNSINGDGSGGLGIFIATGVSNTIISNCNINTYFYGIFNQNGQNNSISQSTITQSISSGIYLDSSNSNNIIQNEFISNAQGIDLVYADQYNTISGNQFVNNTLRGMDVSITSNLNNITLNSFSGNNIDMTFLSSTANYIAENSFSNAGFISLQLVGATSNVFQYNLIGAASRAIDISSTGVSNSFSFNNLTSNTEGVIIDSSNNNAFSGNLFEGANIGFRTINSNVSLSNDRFYGNAADLEVISNTASHSLNATTILLLPSDGSLTNYSNVSIYDVQSGSEDYQINYGSDIPYEDATHIKFNNKRLTFSDIGSNMDIDNFVYHYLNSELNASANTLQMYAWNGSDLLNLGATQGSEMLTKNSLSGVYQVGLYYAPFAISSCRTLNNSGDYEVESDLSGAASCIILNNNSININCADHSITGPGNNTPGAYGIESTAFNNTLIQNCQISEFDRGMSISSGNNFTINGNFIYNVNTGILLAAQNNTTVSENFLLNTTFSGDSAIYVLSSSSNILIDQNEIQNVSGRGIYCSGVTNCNITSNSLSNIGRMGIRSSSGSGGTINNNYVSNSTDRAYLFDLNQANLNITNNFANNSATDGMIFDITGTNIIANNTIINSDTQDYRISTTSMDCYGISWTNNTGSGFVPYLFNNSLGANIANQTVAGLILCGANNSVVNNITIYNAAKQNNVLDVISTSNITLNNINSSHGYSGIITVASSGNVANADLRNANGAAITNTGYGFWANGGNWNVSNTQSANTKTIGFRASNSGILNLVNISSQNDTYGVRVSTAAGYVSITNSSIRDSSNAALHNIGGTLISNNTIVYENTLDVLVNTTASGTFNSTNITLGRTSSLNPKVNLNIYDTIANGDIYSIKIVGSPASPPSGNASIGGKYFNLTKYGNMNITEIDFLWQSSEVSNSSNVLVQFYNGSWSVPSQTLNASLNKIILLTPGGTGVYGLFDITGSSSGIQVLIPEASIAFGIAAYMYYRSQRGGYVRVFILFGWF